MEITGPSAQGLVLQVFVRFRCVERPLFHESNGSGGLPEPGAEPSRSTGRRSEGGILHKSANAGKRKIIEAKKRFSQRMHSFSTPADAAGALEIRNKTTAGRAILREAAFPVQKPQAASVEFCALRPRLPHPAY